MSGLFYRGEPSRALSLAPPPGSPAAVRGLPWMLQSSKVKRNAGVHEGTFRNLLQKYIRDSWGRAGSRLCGMLCGGQPETPAPGGRAWWSCEAWEAGEASTVQAKWWP